MVIQERGAARVFMPITEAHGIDGIVGMVSVWCAVNGEDGLEARIIIIKGKPTENLNRPVPSFCIDWLLRGQMETLVADPAAGVFGVEPLDAEEYSGHVIGSPQRKSQSSGIKAGLGLIGTCDIAQHLYDGVLVPVIKGQIFLVISLVLFYEIDKLHIFLPPMW